MQTDFIRFIGTGSAQESKERFHSSFVFFSEGRYCLIDAGDGISKALLNAEVPYNEIHSIIISHMHPDHYSGLALLLIQMKLIKRTKPLHLFVHGSLYNALINFLNTSYLFPEKLGFPFHMELYENDKFFHPLDNLEVLARQNTHLDSAIDTTPGNISFSCSSYLFNFHNRLIFYTGDIGSEEDLYLFSDYNIDVMISEVTHVEHEKIMNAFTSSGADRLYLTHLSQGDEQTLNSKSKGLDRETSAKISIAKDGLWIQL